MHSIQVCQVSDATLARLTARVITIASSCIWILCASHYREGVSHHPVRFCLLPNSYVLRRILRRGIRYGSEKLNTKPGMFASLVDTVVLLLVSTSAFHFFHRIQYFVLAHISISLCGDGNILFPQASQSSVDY